MKLSRPQFLAETPVKSAINNNPSTNARSERKEGRKGQEEGDEGEVFGEDTAPFCGVGFVVFSFVVGEEEFVV